MKIHIIGCSGTGKTYLAEALSKKYSIHHYDLDDLQWDNTANTYGVRTGLEKRASLLSEILENENWIVEGVYYKWVKQCFEDADVIYVLEIPKYVYKFRIIKRFIRRKVGIEKGKKETLKSLYNLLKWTNEFQNVNMREIKKILSRYKNKVVIIKSNREIQELMN